MARIRTIKPEFFTSEDICGLTPLARLLYIATWCEADKQGRLEWKLGTFKLRYFPADQCDMSALAAELVSKGLVVLYGDGLAFIPKFQDHQHINPRESESKLPVPDASARVATRQHASKSEIDAQGGREGKGREGDMSGEPDASREVLEYLNEQTGHSYQPVEASLKMVRARLAETSLEVCKAVVDAKVGEWTGDTKMAQYLRPATLFNATNFAQYAGQLGSATVPTTSGEKYL